MNNLKFTIMESLDEQTTETKRPVFLTVLCILTFIGSGWGIISSLVMKDPGLADYAGYYYWAMLLLNVGTLFGALQMWKMKKTGLYIWTAAELIGVVLMWIVVKGYIASAMNPVMDAAMDNMSADAQQAMSRLGTSAGAIVEATMNMVLIIGSVFPAVFVLLYWLNAKHLK